MRRNFPWLVLGLLAGLLVLTGCAVRETADETGEEPVEVPEVPEAGRSARAMIEPLGDSGVSGWVSFTEVEGGIQVEASVSGLTPGAHGFHIHEFGDCTSPDGKSAGGHFNPDGVPHAGPEAEQAHAGDLGNIEADEEGNADLALLSHRIVLGEGAANILGRGVIVHDKADDLESQPTGAAGGRLACGVIMLEGGETTPVTAP